MKQMFIVLLPWHPRPVLKKIAEVLTKLQMMVSNMKMRTNSMTVVRKVDPMHTGDNVLFKVVKSLLCFDMLCVYFCIIINAFTTQRRASDRRCGGTNDDVDISGPDREGEGLYTI